MRGIPRKRRNVSTESWCRWLRLYYQSMTAQSPNPFDRSPPRAASSSSISPSPPSDGGEGGERRCVCIGFPLLGPLPTRSSRGEDGELDAALRSTRIPSQATGERDRLGRTRRRLAGGIWLPSGP